VTTNYSYDNIYQLTQATQSGSATETYTYDSVGNRVSSLGASPYNYNVSNELTSTPTAAYTYDSNGNNLTKADICPPAPRTASYDTKFS
jgi:YD repeat-containing protein